MTRLLRWFIGEPELTIDLRRINDEDRAEHRARLYSEDLVYRARVKRRMLAGLTSAQLAPLIDRRKHLEVAR